MIIFWSNGAPGFYDLRSLDEDGNAAVIFEDRKWTRLPVPICHWTMAENDTNFGRSPTAKLLQLATL
jgi:hypothetical protein